MAPTHCRRRGAQEREGAPEKGPGTRQRCGFLVMVATDQLWGGSQAGIRKALGFGCLGRNVV